MNDTRETMRALVNHMVNKYAMPALNAVVPAASAAPQYEYFDAPDDENAGPNFEYFDAPESWVDNPNTQTAIRSTVRGLSAPFTLAIDAPNAAYNLVAKGINAAAPGTMGYLPMAHDYQDAALRGMGVDPKPASTAERVVTAGLGAMSGAGLSGAMRQLPSVASSPALSSIAQSGATMPGRQVAAATGGVLGADTVGALTDDPFYQNLGGALGALFGSGMAGVTNSMAGGLRRAGQALTADGAEKIAARSFYRGTEAPQTAMARLRNPELNREIIPGSRPTTAEVTQDPGQAFQLRALEGSDLARKAGVAGLRNARLAEMDDAINDVLNRANRVPKGGEEDIVNRLRTIKAAAYNKFAEGKDLVNMPIDFEPLRARFDALYTQYQGNGNITRTLERVEKALQVGPRGEESPLNFQRLWNARKEIDNAIYESWKDSDKATRTELARVGEDIRGDMNRALIEADPSFEPFLRRYSFAAQMEGRLLQGRGMARQMQNASRNAPGDLNMLGSRRISAAKSNNLSESLGTDVAGELSAMGKKLSPRQLRAFEAANLEKQRGDWLNTGGGAIGSPTAPYLAEGKLLADDIVSGILGTRSNAAGGAMRKLLETGVGRPLDFALRTAEPGILRMLARAHADPQYALKLLEMADNPMQVTLRGAVENAARTGALGELYSRLGMQ